MGHGPGDIVRVNEDNVKPLVHLTLYTLGMLYSRVNAVVVSVIGVRPGQAGQF